MARRRKKRKFPVTLFLALFMIIMGVSLGNTSHEDKITTTTKALAPTPSTAVTVTHTAAPSETPVPTATPSPTQAPTATPDPVEEEPVIDYVLNKNTGKFHYSYCKSVNAMKEKNKSYFTGTRDEVINRGYEPCGNCHP